MTLNIIVDTNILLSDPGLLKPVTYEVALDELGDSRDVRIIVLHPVLEKLKDLQNDPGERGTRAQEVIKLFTIITENSNQNDMYTNGFYFSDYSFLILDDTIYEFSQIERDTMQAADTTIVFYAERYIQEHPNEEFIFHTDDKLLQTLANSKTIPTKYSGYWQSTTDYGTFDLFHRGDLDGEQDKKYFQNFSQTIQLHFEGGQLTFDIRNLSGLLEWPFQPDDHWLFEKIKYESKTGSKELDYSMLGFFSHRMSYQELLATIPWQPGQRPERFKYLLYRVIQYLDLGDYVFYLCVPGQTNPLFNMLWDQPHLTFTYSFVKKTEEIAQRIQPSETESSYYHVKNMVEEVQNNKDILATLGVS